MKARSTTAKNTTIITAIYIFDICDTIQAHSE
jgi:hypothetical protein